MNFGEELKSAAIVGTAQKEPDFAALGGKLGETLSKIDRAEREKYLLSTAAVFSIWNNAGKTLQTDSQNAPETSENETGGILQGRLKQIFETLLQSTEKAEFLPEFLLLMTERGKIIPPELLPVVLSSDHHAPKIRQFDFRHLFLPVIGNRGRWLAKKRDGWRWGLVEKSGEELWETGKLNERIFALEYFRHQNPISAHEKLQTVWSGESAKERQKFLEVLGINLSQFDEEFLDEVFRIDKSAEVKRTAFELLANLPDSKLSQKIKELIVPVFSIKKKLLAKREIEIELSADWIEKTTDLKNIGKQIFGNTKYFGEKAIALAVGLSIINPQAWEKELDLNPSEIISLAHKNEWARALLAGFGLASMRFGNEVWAAEVLKFNSKFALTMSPLYAWGRQTFELIDEEKLISIICGYPHYAFTDWLLQQLKFEPAKTLDFIKTKNLSTVTFTNTERNTGWKNLAFILPPELIEKWIAELERTKSQKGLSEYQQNFLEEVIENLRFRKEYILEFEK